jgi:hypothetical protein
VSIQVPSVFTVRLPSKDSENYTLEYKFQHMPRSLPGQSQKINSSQPVLNDNWTKVSYKRGRSTQEGTEREAKHAIESEHWLNQTSTSNRYTALLEEESEDKQQNHPANYKGCIVYKDLQKKTYPPLHLKQYTPPAQIKHYTLNQE